MYLGVTGGISAFLWYLCIFVVFLYFCGIYVFVYLGVFYVSWRYLYIWVVFIYLGGICVYGLQLQSLGCYSSLFYRLSNFNNLVTVVIFHIAPLFLKNMDCQN